MVKKIERILHVFFIDNKPHKEYDLSLYCFGIENGILSVFSTETPLTHNLEQEIFPLTTIDAMEIRRYGEIY